MGETHRGTNTNVVFFISFYFFYLQDTKVVHLLQYDKIIYRSYIFSYAIQCGTFSDMLSANNLTQDFMKAEALDVS